MLDLNNITIVSVACIRAERALKAIKFSMREINFAKSKILTSENIKDDIVEVINIKHLDYIGYNHFIVYELWKYIDTEYVLLIQDDGFVVNANRWKDEFYNYDYIGAPWEIPSDDFSYRDIYGNIVRVGNGGFSFRSRKILELPTKLNIDWIPYFGFYNEDGFITCHNRHLLEEHGCKFADINIAKYFSHEKQIPETFDIIPFGFHGKQSNYNFLLD